MKILVFALAAAALLGVCADLCRADDTALVQAARTAAKNYDDAIINISLVVKVTAQSSLPLNLGSGKEQQVETVGTVIDSAGMVVTSLTAIDPIRAMPSMKVNVPGAGEGTIDFNSELHDLKIRLPDSTEIKGRVVLKDEDLDLAFIIPDDTPDAATLAKFVAFPLTNVAPAAEIVDPIILLGRTGKSFNYTPTLNLARITACVSKPRKCYLGATTLGTPVLDGQGRILGLIVNKVDHERKELNSAMGAPGPTLNTIILPIAEVNTMVIQARREAAKPRPATAASATAPATTQAAQ
jgi:hypothetical protein